MLIILSMLALKKKENCNNFNYIMIITNIITKTPKLDTLP